MIESPTGPGRSIRPGWKIGSIGRAPPGAQPYQGGWGRQGGDKGRYESMWNAQGGCTLSRPKIGDRIMSQSAPKQRKPITSRNHYIVDGTGGRESNNLDENFQGVRWKERQAQPNPQNLVGWCPGSSLTNLSDPHPRAGLDRPTSAEVVTFEMGSRLDHPRSYQCDCRHESENPLGGLGQALVVTWKPPGGPQKIWRVIYQMTAGSILAQAINII